jgi:predicted nucleotidyltransferase
VATLAREVTSTSSSDLDADAGNALLRIAGIGEELSDLLGVRVDVVTDELLRQPVSDSARSLLVAL